MKTWDFIMQMHIYWYFSCLYATHIVYRQIHGLCWFMYIWSYMYNWHFWKMLFLHCLCLFFSLRQKYFWWGEMKWFISLGMKTEVRLWLFKVLRWILRSCSSFLVLIFTTTVHNFFAGLYIRCKCNIDIAPCIYHWMPCLTVEIGARDNFGESHNPPGMYNSVYLKIF